MSVTLIKSRWVAGKLEFYDAASGNTVLQIDTNKIVAPLGIEGAVTGGTTGDVSGGNVNPTLNIIAGEAIAANDLVYISGFDATSGKYKVSKADADLAAPANVALFIAPAAIENAAAGTVVGELLVTGLNTDAAAAVGAPVYLSTTAGAWTLTAPDGGGHTVQQVGVVTAKHASTGAIKFFPFYSKATTVNTTG